LNEKRVSHPFAPFDNPPALSPEQQFQVDINRLCSQVRALFTRYAQDPNVIGTVLGVELVEFAVLMRDDYAAHPENRPKEQAWWTAIDALMRAVMAAENTAAAREVRRTFVELSNAPDDSAKQ
jgi:hypothetical protein